MEAILQVTYLYMLTLLLSLTVERLMEILNAGWNFVELRCEMHKFWTRRAIALQKTFQRKATSRLWNRMFDLSGLAFQIRRKLLDKKLAYSGKILIISGDLVRHASLVVANRVVSSAMGILFCATTDINLLRVVKTDLQLEYAILDRIPVWLAIALSGILVGAGAEPVHHVIKFIEKRRKQ